MADTVSFSFLMQDAEDSVNDRENFFEEPPPQVVHQNFTQMNLSRPLLRV